MNVLGASPALVLHLAVLSMISFGGIPAMLPSLRDYVVTGNGWITDQDFANCFAVVQAIPGPNMILMMSFIGWKIGGLPIAIASALATFVPPCTISFVVFRWWERFREARWQGLVRRGLTPVTIGLVIAGGYAMAQASDVGWASTAVTIAAAGLLLLTPINPLWMLGAGAALGGLGLL
jgi:chromate transporter